MESLVKAIVNEKGVGLQGVERVIWVGMVKILGKVLVQLLEAIDRELLATRDPVQGEDKRCLYREEGRRRVRRVDVVVPFTRNYEQIREGLRRIRPRRAFGLGRTSHPASAATRSGFGGLTGTGASSKPLF